MGGASCESEENFEGVHEEKENEEAVSLNVFVFD